jgi:hypothetical protein
MAQWHNGTMAQWHTDSTLSDQDTVSRQNVYFQKPRLETANKHLTTGKKQKQIVLRHYGIDP